MRHILTLLVFAAVALAEPVQITDTIKTPFTGVLFSGTITIMGPKMTTAAGDTVAQWQAEYPVANGLFSAQLQPNDTALPPGTSYSVRYVPDKTKSRVSAWSETWVVPSSATPLKINQVRVLAPTSPHPTVMFADAETPDGAVDGVNREFRLQHSPTPASSLVITRNGMVMKAGVDYTLAGNVVTFIEQQTPQSGAEGTDILIAWYRY